MKQNLKLSCTFLDAGLACLPDASLKPDFGSTFLRPFFLSSFFCCVAIFWLGGLWGPDLFFLDLYQESSIF
jgi:hypothetical protein